MKNFKSADDQQSENLISINRPSLLKQFCLLALGLSFWIGACDFRKVEAQTETNSKKENKMESVKSATTIQHNIPPLDATTVPEIETATFALG